MNYKGWLLKVPVGTVPIDHISQEQVGRIRELASMVDMSVEDSYVNQELIPDSELGWDNVAYVELSLPYLTPYVHVYTLDVTLHCLRIQIHNVLGGDVPADKLERAMLWLISFSTNDDTSDGKCLESMCDGCKYACTTSPERDYED